MFLSFNLQSLRYERRSMEFQYLSCMTHAQLSKATDRIECEIGCVVELVDMVKIFLAQEFCYGIGISRDVNM